MIRSVPWGMILIGCLAAVLPLRAEDRSAVCLLAIDYLPNIVYIDEPVTAVFRVINSGTRPAEGTLDVAAVFGPGSATSLKTGTFSLEAGAEIQFTYSLEHMVFSRAARKFEAVVAIGDAEPVRRTVRIVRPADPLPGFRLEEGHCFVSDEGERVVFTIAHRVYIENRKWFFARWFRERLTPARGAATCLFIGAPLTGGTEDDSYLALLRDRIKGLSTVVLPDIPEPAAFPVLAAAALTDTIIEPPVRERTVLFLPYSDMLMGSGRREYRMCCELIVQRLLAAGCMDIRLIAPARPAPLTGRCAAYNDQLADIARIYGLTFLAADELNDPAWWSAGGRAFGRYPNAEGHQAFADYLVKAIE